MCVVHGMQDGRTDMSQFGIQGFYGYLQYCMKKLPKCMCTENDKVTTNYTGDLVTRNGWLNRSQHVAMVY